jgi:adenine-specific DNA-methyltransferase
MPVKYIPYVPDTIEGQAILDNITRTRRVLRYHGSGQVFDRLRRGLPLYETTETEVVGDPSSANLLLRGECLSACAYLKDKGITLDLVYIDPPFASGADYAKSVYLRRHPHKAEEIAAAEEELELDELRAFEEKMYGDIWNKEDYLNWMFENLTAIKSVMSETASIYVHLDWHIGHYVKIVMDEVFGEDNFEREIVWSKGNVSGFKSLAKNWIQAHDTIFYYTRSSDGSTFNKQRIQYTEEYLENYNKEDENGEKYWQWSSTERRYLKDAKGLAVSDVWDMPYENNMSSNRTEYATQKPEALLERVIKASSNEGMIVGDFFGGSGVTAKVAYDLGRRFVHVDVGVNSLQTTRDRLKAAGAAFTVRDIQDGVSLFRNPIQTMDKLKTLIVGLKNEDGLDKFWDGAIKPKCWTSRSSTASFRKPCPNCPTP